jgi:hypothetical protein
MIQLAGILPAFYLGDRLAAEDAGAQKVEIALALAHGAQARPFPPQILFHDVLECIALGGPFGRLGALLGCHRIVPGAGLAQRPGGQLPGRGQGQWRAVLGRVGRLGHAFLGQAWAQRQLALQATKAVAENEALAAGWEHHHAQTDAAAIRHLIALRARPQVGDRDRGEGLDNAGVSPG